MKARAAVESFHSRISSKISTTWFGSTDRSGPIQAITALACPRPENHANIYRCTLGAIEGFQHRSCLQLTTVTIHGMQKVVYFNDDVCVDVNTNSNQLKQKGKG